MLNLYTPEAPNRKFFLGTSSSRKENVSYNKITSKINRDKENETPNVTTPNDIYINKKYYHKIPYYH